MRFAIVFMLTFIAALTIWPPKLSAQDEVYRWVDENGVVHFGDRAPQQQEAEVVSIPQTSGINLQPPADPQAVNTADEQEPQPSAAQQARDARAAARQEREAKAEVTAKSCKSAREVVSQLEPSPRVNVIHEDGTVTRMDDNDRLEKLAEAKAYVAENCSN